MEAVTRWKSGDWHRITEARVSERTSSCSRKKSRQMDSDEGRSNCIKQIADRKQGSLADTEEKISKNSGLVERFFPISFFLNNLFLFSVTRFCDAKQVFYY